MASLTCRQQNDHLTLARHAQGLTEGDPPVDVPMRTFSGAYYANLFQILKYLRVGTRVHYFRYHFRRGATQYFQFFSNFHRIRPCIQNEVWINLYLLACYLWYTIAVFMLPPRLRGTDRLGRRETRTETLDQYARRIRLPDAFLDWYLLPLFSSVATCSHADLRQCPAAYIANYRKGTIGAHHRTVADMQALQSLLTENVVQRLRTEVHGVRPEGGRVELQFCKLNHDTDIQTEVFDFAVLATSATQAGGLFPDIRPITSRLKEGRVRISVMKAKPSRRKIQETASEILDLETYNSASSGPITQSTHQHQSGVKVVVSPCQTPDNGPAGRSNDGEAQVFDLCRPLPTPQSHELLLSVLGKVATDGKPAWTNGQDGVYLAGGYASAGLPLLEACVRSALKAAVAIGAELPFALIENTPF